LRWQRVIGFAPDRELAFPSDMALACAEGAEGDAVGVDLCAASDRWGPPGLAGSAAANQANAAIGSNEPTPGRLALRAARIAT
jgi:hypothetical protein